MDEIPDRNDDGFIRYPTNRIVGTIDSSEELQAAITSLLDAGIDKDGIEMLCGEAGAQRLDRTGKRHGLIAQLIRIVQYMGEEQMLLQHHEQELRAGHFLVSAPVSDEGSKQQVRELLKSHGGHFIHYYGRLGIEDL